MSDEPQGAYDPDSTPNDLADVTGQDHKPPQEHYTAPHPQGETFTDAGGEVRHVAPGKDGVVHLADTQKKPWLDVVGHGEE